MMLLLEDFTDVTLAIEDTDDHDSHKSYLAMKNYLAIKSYFGIKSYPPIKKLSGHKSYLARKKFSGMGIKVIWP